MMGKRSSTATGAATNRVTGRSRGVAARGGGIGGARAVAAKAKPARGGGGGGGGVKGGGKKGDKASGKGAVQAAQTAVDRKGPELSGYAAALKWVLERPNFEAMRPGRAAADLLKLERMRVLLRLLGDPQVGLRCVHVAGTKGKGSVCAMTAACLQGCGYTVGLYTSPHLVDVRERIRLGGKMVSTADFARLAQRVADAAANLPEEKEEGGGGPTYFEVLTAMGLLHFAEQAVDVAVIEVGLGGRLDATNVITPEVAAITNISWDHWQVLGNTLGAIAREKAGIFKAGVPALTYAQAPGVLEVLRAGAARVGCELRVLGEEVEFSSRFEATARQPPHVRVSVSTARNSYEHVAAPLMGEHQGLNCGLALAIVDALSARGLPMPEPKVTAGLARTACEGRMEIACARPRVLLDGAHNAESVRALMKAMGAQVPYDSLVVIFGCAADKDVEGMLKHLALGADKVIFTKSSASARAADPGDLARRFDEEHGKMSQTAGSVVEALRLAQRAVGRDDLICVTGSFYLVGDAKKHLAQAAGRRGEGQGE